MLPPNSSAAPGAAVSHLNSVADTPELRAAYKRRPARVTEFGPAWVPMRRLYAKYKGH